MDTILHDCAAGYTCSYAIASLLARVFLGVLFLFQGYDKVFKVGITGVVEAFEAPLATRHITRGILRMAAFYTSWAELIGGALLVMGLFKTIALSLLGLDLLFVAFAFGLIKPMWDMQHVFPRLVLLLFLLMLPGSMDIYSLDHFLL